MKLYMVPLAPNPTKVMLYIAEREELGVEMGIDQIVVNTVKGRHKEPAHLARNPFGNGPHPRAGRRHVHRGVPRNHGVPRGQVPRMEPSSAAVAEDRGHARDVERVVDLRIAGPMGVYGHAKNSPLGLPPDPKRAAQMEAALQTPLDYLEQLLSDGRPLPAR